MQKRIAKLYSFLFLTAFAFALVLTACSDSNNNNSKPSEPTTAKLDMSVALPDTAKTLADTQQILVYLQKNGQVVDGSQCLYTDVDETPYIKDVDSKVYEDYPKSGATPRHVEFEYETSEVGVPVTIVMEYLGESKDDIIAISNCYEPAGLTASNEPEPYTRNDFTTVNSADAKIVCVPDEIDTYVGESTGLKVTAYWDVVYDDITNAATYTVVPDTLGTVTAGKFTAGAVAGTGNINIGYLGATASVPVKVSEKPSPEDKYYLVADCSKLTDKAKITDVKIGEFATKYDGEKYSATTTEKQEVASYYVTVTVDGKTLKTKSAKKFEEPKEGEESVVTLEDKDFEVKYNLVIDYSEVSKFSKDTVKSIVSTDGVEFTIDKATKTATKTDYEFDETGKVSMNLVVTDGVEAAAKTKTALEFSVEKTDAKLTDDNFPAYFTLEVDYSGVPEEQMDVDDVTEVYFGGDKANAPSKEYVVTLARQTEDMLNKPVDIRFFGKDDLRKQAQVTFTAEHLTQYVTSVVDATYEMTVDLTQIVEQKKTRGIAPDYVTLNEDEEGKYAYKSEGVSDNKAVIKNCAPGQYKVTIYDVNGNTYESSKIVDVEFTETERTVTLEASDFEGEEVSLALELQKDVVELLDPLPDGAFVKVSEDTEVELFRGAGTNTLSSNPEEMDSSYTGCGVRLVWKDGSKITKEMALAKTVDFNLENTATTDYEVGPVNAVKIDKTYLKTYKMKVVYGNGKDYNAYRIVDSEVDPENYGIYKVEVKDLLDEPVGEFTIDKDATNAKQLVAVAETTDVIEAGGYSVTFTQGKSGVPGDSFGSVYKEFKLVDDELVCELMDSDIDVNQKALYKVDVTGFTGEKQKVSDIKKITYTDTSNVTYKADFVEADETHEDAVCYWQQMEAVGELASGSVEAYTNGGLLDNEGYEVKLSAFGPTGALCGNCEVTEDDTMVAVHLDINKTANLTRIDASQIKSVWYADQPADLESANVYYLVVPVGSDDILLCEQTTDEISEAGGITSAHPVYDIRHNFTEDDNGKNYVVVDNDVLKVVNAHFYVPNLPAPGFIEMKVVYNGTDGPFDLSEAGTFDYYKAYDEITEGMDLDMVVTFSDGSQTVAYTKKVSVASTSTSVDNAIEVDIKDGTWIKK